MQAMMEKEGGGPDFGGSSQPCPESVAGCHAPAHLVTYCEAGQIRQNLRNMNTTKIAVMFADILKGLILGKRHRCPGSEVTEGSGPKKDGLRGG